MKPNKQMKENKKQRKIVGKKDGQKGRKKRGKIPTKKE